MEKQMKNSFFSTSFAWRQQGKHSLHRMESKEREGVINKTKAIREREKNKEKRGKETETRQRMKGREVVPERR